MKLNSILAITLVLLSANLMVLSLIFGMLGFSFWGLILLLVAWGAL